MAASGLDPITEEQTKQGNHQHIVHLMEFSFKILETISQFNGFTFGTNFIMKIGFNYGPVTDGIIGHTKVHCDTIFLYIFDLSIVLILVSSSIIHIFRHQLLEKLTLQRFFLLPDKFP